LRAFHRWDAFTAVAGRAVKAEGNYTVELSIMYSSINELVNDEHSLHREIWHSLAL